MERPTDSPRARPPGTLAMRGLVPGRSDAGYLGELRRSINASTVPIVPIGDVCGRTSVNPPKSSPLGHAARGGKPKPEALPGAVRENRLPGEPRGDKRGVRAGWEYEPGLMPSAEAGGPKGTFTMMLHGS